MSNKIIVITKKTSYSKFIQDQDDENAKDLLERNHPVVTFWKSAHDSHMRTLDFVINEIKKQNLICTVIDSKSFCAEPDDVSLVISVGGDGTLLSASHNLNNNIPILGVNSDPATSIGFFCYSTITNFSDHLQLALNNECQKTILTRMQVIKNGKVMTKRILNDVLFCHINPAATSNYILQLESDENVLLKETQKSSGFWIGPAAGSTAARRSAGASPMNLSSNDLQLRVRELYHRPTAKPGLNEIIANQDQSFKIISKMDSAAMYLDGDYSIIPVGLGDELCFNQSNEPLILLGKPNVFCG